MFRLDNYFRKCSSTRCQRLKQTVCFYFACVGDKLWRILRDFTSRIFAIKSVISWKFPVISTQNLKNYHENCWKRKNRFYLRGEEGRGLAGLCAAAVT